MKDHPFIDRLDRIANRTGIPQMAAGNPRRRHMRWLPIIALLLAVAGTASAIIVGAPQYWIAYAVTVFAFFTSLWMPLFGPIKPWQPQTTVDEYDRALRSQAYLATLPVITILAVGALFGLAVAAILLRWDVSHLGLRMMTTAFLLMTIWNAVPTLYASWATRPIGEND